MKKILLFVLNDLKNIFRDKILAVMFFVPILFFLMLQYAFPILYLYVPETKEYEWLIAMVVCSVVAAMPAYIFSFIMLDEKDENITEVFKVVPFQLKMVVVYRLAFIGLFSFVSIILLLSFTLSGYFSLFHIAVIALSFALNGAMGLLVIVAFARDKIVAVTMSKALNFFLMLPVLCFIFDIKWLAVLSLIPNFWIFKMVENITYNTNYGISLLIALVFHSLLLFILFRFYLKRSYQS